MGGRKQPCESFSSMNPKTKILDWIAATLREAAWAPLGVVAFYLIGLALGLFDRFPPLDIPTHLLGGAAITYFYRSAIRNSQPLVGDIPLPIRIVFAFTSTGTTTVLWEFYENAFDFLFGTHMVRGLEDTITDLLMGFTGALALTLLYRRR
jgi:hypothetical protein